MVEPWRNLNKQKANSATKKKKREREVKFPVDLIFLNQFTMRLDNQECHYKGRGRPQQHLSKQCSKPVEPGPLWPLFPLLFSNHYCCISVDWFHFHIQQDTLDVSFSLAFARRGRQGRTQDRFPLGRNQLFVLVKTSGGLEYSIWTSMAEVSEYFIQTESRMINSLQKK